MTWRQKSTLLIILISLAVLFGMCGRANAKSLTTNERNLLDLAYQYGQRIGYPTYIQAILLNESYAGRYGRHGDKHFKNWKRQCYGIMQIQYSTAEWIIKTHLPQYSCFTPEKLRWLLTYDNLFNLKLATTYYEHLVSLTKDPMLALLAYNVGYGRVKSAGFKFDPNNYVAKAKRAMATTLREINPKSNIYVVQKGDTLSIIAQKVLGNLKFWRKIARDNNISNPDFIEVGQQLIVRR